MSARFLYTLAAAALFAGCSTTSTPDAIPVSDAADDPLDDTSEAQATPDAVSEPAAEAQTESGAPQGPAANATQLVVVISKEWKAVPASLSRYEATTPGGPWTQVGIAFPVELGYSGLGWGRGLHPKPPSGDPVKHEGDGRSPAGAFELKIAFGYAAPAAASWVRLQYLQATSDLE